MAVTFPTSPTDGQQVTANGKTFTFSSASGTWNITGTDNPIDILFTRSEFVATADQTTFSVTYNTDYPIEVFVNGLQYLASDYTATDGTSVVFDTGLPADAEVIIMYATSSLSTIPDSLTDLSITDGTIGQVLTTDGSGAFTFEDAASGDRYTSKVISENTVLDSNTEFFTGDETEISHGATLTIPDNSILEIKKFGTGKPL